MEPKETSFNLELITVFETMINCYLVHIVAIVGIFGNILTMIVMSRIGFKDTSNILLLSLSACDLFYLLSLSIQKMFCILRRFKPILGHIYRPYAVTYVYIYGRLSMLISVSHIVIISIERFLVVVFPLKVSRWITRGRMSAVLACTYIFWIIFWSPWLVAYREVRWKFSNFYNRTLPFESFTDWFQKNKLILNIFEDIVINCIFIFFCLVVAVNCCVIAYKLRQLTKQRQTMTLNKLNRKDGDAKISRMLLIVCIVYSCYNIPAVTIFFYFYVSPDTPEAVRINTLLLNLEELLMAVNATADFFIYILMSAKFYKSVISLFTGKS